MVLSQGTLITNAMLYLYITVFCLLGAIIKDSYNTIIEKEKQVKISRVLVSTVVSSIILFSLSDYLLSRISYKILILLCFIGGMIGFESLSKITRLSFWLKVFKEKKDIVDKLVNEANDDKK